MKRLHMHVAVDDIDQSVRFYSALFASEPAIKRVDYAKWMLDDPRMNFAISAHGGRPGIDHLGIQVETREELAEVYGRLRRADQALVEQGATTCCYARSEKAWIADPSGLSWETFLTTGESTEYGDVAGLGPIRTTSGEIVTSACCASVMAEGSHPQADSSSSRMMSTCCSRCDASASSADSTCAS